MTQTVLLAGATGMLGSEIARRLLVRGGDAARRAALDPLLARGAEIIEGDLADRASRDGASILDAADVIEVQTGCRFERRSNGSEAGLRAAMAEAAKDTSNPFKAVMLAYQLYTLTGQTALSDLQNGRYPGLPLESFAGFAARALPRRAVA